MSNGIQWEEGPLTQPIGSGRLERLLTAAIKNAKKRGVNIHANSRVELARNFLHRINTTETVLDWGSTSFIDDTLAHQRIAIEFFLIAYAQYEDRNNSETPFTKSQLKIITEGPVLASSGNDRPRDIQYQLRIAAELRLGGVSVFGMEPDVVFRYRDNLIGIAAKRVRSLRIDQLERHIKKAADQIARSRKPGFIALDIESRCRDISPDQDRDEVLAEFERVFDATIAYAKREAQQTDIVGLRVDGYAASRSVSLGGGALPGMQIISPSTIKFLTDPCTVGTEQEFFEFFSMWRARYTAHVRYLISDDFRDGLPPG